MIENDDNSKEIFTKLGINESEFRIWEQLALERKMDLVHGLVTLGIILYLIFGK